MLEVPDIKVKDAVFRLILTNKRLILSEKGMSGEISSQIPIPVIISATSEMNDSGEPVLTITIKAPDGSDRKMMFVFLQNSGTGDRSYERDALLHEIEGGDSRQRGESSEATVNRNKADTSVFRPEVTSPRKSVIDSARSPSSQNAFHQPPPPPASVNPRGSYGNMDSSYGFESERTPSRGGADSIRSSSSHDEFRQPPPVTGDPREPFSKTDPSYDFESERSPSHRGSGDLVRNSSSRDGFHQPPPPPVSVNPRGFYGNMNSSYGFESERSPSYRDSGDLVRNSSSDDGFRQPPPPPVSGSSRGSYGNMNSSYGSKAERYPSRRTNADPIRGTPSYDGFRQAPSPPPSSVGNPQGSYGNPHHQDSSGGFRSANRSSARTYDPFPDERVAPQYARRVGRENTDRSGRQAGGEFVYTPPSRRQRSAPRRNEHGSRRSGGGYSGSDSVPGTIIGLIRSPGETFREARSKEVGDAVPALLVSFAIFAFGSTFFLGLIASDASAYPYLSGLSDMGTMIFVAIEMIVIGVICVALTGVLMHYVAYYEGFDEDISQSLKVAAYSSAPFAVGGIIPFVGIIIAPFWSVYLLYTGMCETFYMDSDQAVVAVLVPVAVFAAFFIFMITFGGDNFSIFG